MESHNSQCSNTLYDVIVIGAGIMGSATAYNLAKQGKKTLLLEQFLLPHSRGSSHGPSRIVRTAYPQSHIAGIMPTAVNMWKTLEQEASTQLMRETGVLIFSSTLPDIIEAYRSNIAKVTVDGSADLMSQQQLKESFPSISFTSADVGCVDAGAGTLFADKCVQAFQKVFVQNGGVIYDNQKVKEIVPGSIASIKTDTKVYKTRGVVLTCGPWADNLLGKLDIEIPLQCEAIQVCYWKNKPGCNVTPINAAFITREKDTHIYGLPEYEYPGLMKICLHYGVVCDPDTRDRVDTKQEAEHLAHLKEFIVKRFPYLIPEPAIKERCICTVTPDKECVIGSHSTYKNIVYAAGFSGHGFKMAPVIGSMLADLVQQRKPKHYVKEFAADRLLKKSKT